MLEIELSLTACSNEGLFLEPFEFQLSIIRLCWVRFERMTFLGKE